MAQSAREKAQAALARTQTQVDKAREKASKLREKATAAEEAAAAAESDLKALEEERDYITQHPALRKQEGEAVVTTPDEPGVVAETAPLSFTS